MYIEIKMDDNDIAGVHTKPIRETQLREPLAIITKFFRITRVVLKDFRGACHRTDE